MSVITKLPSLNVIMYIELNSLLLKRPEFIGSWDLLLDPRYLQFWASTLFNIKKKSAIFFSITILRTCCYQVSFRKISIVHASIIFNNIVFKVDGFSRSVYTLEDCIEKLTTFDFLKDLCIY